MIRLDRIPRQFSDKNRAVIVKKLPQYIKILIMEEGSKVTKLRGIQLRTVITISCHTSNLISTHTDNRPTSHLMTMTSA